MKKIWTYTFTFLLVFNHGLIKYMSFCFVTLKSMQSCLIYFVDFFMKFLDFWLRKLVFEFLEFVVNSPSVEEVFLLSAMDLLLETEEAILEVGQLVSSLFLIRRFQPPAICLNIVKFRQNSLQIVLIKSLKLVYICSLIDLAFYVVSLADPLFLILVQIEGYGGFPLPFIPYLYLAPHHTYLSINI